MSRWHVGGSGAGVRFGNLERHVCFDRSVSDADLAIRHVDRDHFNRAFALTFGLIAMYILASLGVIKYYRGEGRAERSVLKHVVCPLLSVAAMLVVAYKSLFPLPDPRLIFAVYFFLGYSALGGLVLLFLKLSGRDGWLAEAGNAAESALGRDSA